MEEEKEISTPIAAGTKLDMDKTYPCVEHKLQKRMIGSLLYLIISISDIVFSVVLCARFQADPKEYHLKFVKRILRYLIGTSDLSLWYLKGINFKLVGYVDAHYTDYLVDSKSTTCMAHFLGSCLISQSTKKQNYVALSTAEVEYIIVGSCCAQFLWIKKQLKDFGMDVGCVLIFCDNTSAINIVKDPVQYKRTKHIDI